MKDESVNPVKIGLMPLGEQCSNSKLTKNDIIEIRDMWEGGGLSQRQIGKRFRVNQSTICRIVNKKQWVHVNE